MTERLLMADRAGEAEPVVVETDEKQVRLVLDDGEVLAFDHRELASAIEGDE